MIGTRWVRPTLVGIGIAIAAYLTLLHYDAQIPLVCSQNGLVNCNAVLTSLESQWWGIPVSAWGLGWFILYAVFLARGVPAGWRLGWVGVGVVAVVYLIYVEFVVLGAICLWCSALHLTILSLFGIETVAWIRAA